VPFVGEGSNRHAAWQSPLRLSYTSPVLVHKAAVTLIPSVMAERDESKRTLVTHRKLLGGTELECLCSRKRVWWNPEHPTAKRLVARCLEACLSVGFSYGH